MSTMIRTRWAAVGAAVAISLGVGGVGLVQATKTSGERAVYTAIEPCRILDTRPAYGIGGRTAPIGPNETYNVVATGDHGECTGIPTDAVALGLNVTPVNPSQATDLRFWGSGSPPNASSLNPAPGTPPIPNAVTTELAGDGSFNLLNKFGTVHVIIDIVGVYQDHNHDDRYDNADAGVSFDAGDALAADGTDKLVASVSLDVRTVGYTVVNASLSGFGFAAQPTFRCSITTGTTLDTDNMLITDVGTNQWGTISLTRGYTNGFVIIGGSTVTYNLVCDADATNLLTDINMTALFVPDEDASPIIIFP